MKIKLGIVFVILFLSRILFSAIDSPTNGQSFNIGANVTFQWSAPTSMETGDRWHFPDGIVNSTASYMSPSVVTHQVKTVGSYFVRYEYHDYSNTYYDSVTINIIENRSITTTETTYTVDTPIHFSANNVSTPSGIRWVIGDGTNELTSSNFTHTFKKTGTYIVKAYDFNGDTATTPITLTITVSENKYITVTPSVPYAGQLLTFTAVNFSTPSSIKWDMGDGTILRANSPIVKRGAKRLSGSTIQYTYTNPGNYTVRAYDNEGTQEVPISLSISVAMPNRQIEYLPETNIRVDQPVYFAATGFLTSVIDWNLGDGTVLPGQGTTVTHRFQNAGTFVVTAKDSTIDHTPAEKQIIILPENREIILASPEVRVKDPVQITALNFRGDLILWDFGDGVIESSGHTVTHIYERGGTHTIKARDENGESTKEFTATIMVRGISDEVNLEIAEIMFDNGKYYKIVPKNSKELKAILKMKMNGTGSVSGYWIVDGNPFEYFDELAVQGELKEISTRRIPGLPTMDPGMHTVTVRLTKPAEVALTFPVLRYYVLPFEIVMETVAPKDGFVVKEKDIPTFTWKEPRGASKYRLGFSNYIYPLLMNEKSVTWVKVGSRLSYTPTKQVWNKIMRNKWTYWKVRAYDTNGRFIAESETQDIKVVIAKAEITIDSITDLDGKAVEVVKGIVKSKKKALLVNGSIVYKGHSKYIVLRVYAGEKLIDQLLFRNVKKGELRTFESSIPNDGNSKIKFEVLKTSSPSVIIGIKGLILKKK